MSGAVSATSLSTIALGLGAAGMVTSAAGAYRQSEAAQNAYNYQSKVAANNAQIAEWQARDAVTRGQKAEQAQRLKTAQLMSTQRAGFAARGVALDEGSPLAILQDTDYMGELDALAIRDNAAREAWGYENQAAGMTSDSSMLRSRADAEDPNMAAFGTLLTGAGSVASSWYSRKATTGKVA